MSEKSILDQIILNHKAEEVASLDAVEIIGSLFNELNERERDVLTRRFGLHGKGKETLENIGKVHELTRERIRQIENSGVKKLLELKNLENYVSNLKKVINQLIEEHGGLIESDYLLNNLVSFSSGVKEKEDLHKNHLEFLISKLLENEFESVKNSKYFKNYFKYKHQEISHMEKIAEELLNKIKELKKTLQTEDLINLTKGLDGYKNKLDQLDAPSVIDLSSILKSDFFEENAEVINSNKVIFSILQAAKDIEQNKFGYWGPANSREIKPKTINDKIYLVLNDHGKPMHFVEIADKINEISFDSKRANAATVHNELILDSKYVLVGRGLYSLKDWGYKRGTVADIVIDILNKSEEPMSRDDILEKVLEQRLVKKATIILALMDKDKFERVEGGKYRLKSS